jgi:hypothetical protein
MVEIFRTNVADPHQARRLRDLIVRNFSHYEASFDLEDCDRILRVKNTKGNVQSERIISLFYAAGFNAQLLPDNYPHPVIQSLINSASLI